MKNILKSAVLLFAVMIIAGTSNLKAQKIGFIDLQELMQLMPEYKKVATEMDTFGKSLQDELQRMTEEYQKEAAALQKVEKTLSDPIREVRIKGLQEMQSRIQDFQQSAQENFNKKQAELYKPIIEKAKTAIGQVAKETGYAYILDSGVSGILYKPENDNIMGAVKKKLGIL